MEARDRVVETSTTTGAGDFTLEGSPVGYLPFSPEFALNVQFEYLIEIENQTQWEVGVGHLSDAVTLVRDSVTRSTNANTFVVFGSGLKTVSNILTAYGLGLKQNLDGFADGEVPTGTQNGSNAAFTLANTPIANSEHLYLNGMRMKRGEDYTITGAAITMINIPFTGDALLTDYRY